MQNENSHNFFIFEVLLLNFLYAIPCYFNLWGAILKTAHIWPPKISIGRGHICPRPPRLCDPKIGQVKNAIQIENGISSIINNNCIGIPKIYWTCVGCVVIPKMIVVNELKAALNL